MRPPVMDADPTTRVGRHPRHPAEITPRAPVRVARHVLALMRTPTAVVTDHGQPRGVGVAAAPSPLRLTAHR